MNQAKIDQIKALLALAQSPNEHEAALANNRAQAMMQKYLIDEDMLNTERPPEVISRIITADSVIRLGLQYNLRNIPILINFHNSVAQYLKMMCITWTDQRNAVERLTIYGFEFQHQIFDYLLESLLNQGKESLNEAIREHGGIAFHGFWPTYLGKLQNRIYEFGKKDKSTEQGLVIINKVKAKVQQDIPDLQSRHIDGYRQTNIHAVEAAERARFDKAVSNDGKVRQGLLG